MKEKSTNNTTQAKFFSTSRDKLIPSITEKNCFFKEKKLILNKNNSTSQLSCKNKPQKLKVNNFEKERYNVSDIMNLKFRLGIIKGKKVIIQEADTDEIIENKDSILINLNPNKDICNEEIKTKISEKLLRVLDNSDRKMNDKMRKLKETLDLKEEKQEERHKIIQKKKSQINHNKDNISKKREIRSKVAKLVSTNSYFLCQDFLFKNVNFFIMKG